MIIEYKFDMFYNLLNNNDDIKEISFDKLQFLLISYKCNKIESKNSISIEI